MLLAMVLLGAPAAAAQNTMSVHVALPGFDSHVLLDSFAKPRTIDAARAQVFSATRAVLAELKIPMTHSDSLRGTLANVKLELRRRLAGKRLSELVSCGRGLTGDNADSFLVTMAIGAFVDSVAPAQASLRLAVAAGAREMEGISKPPVTCESTGALEDMIAGRVTRTLGLTR